MKAHEDILVFSPAGCSNGSSPPMVYNPQMEQGKPYKVLRAGSQFSLSSSRSGTCRVPTINNGERYPRSVLYFQNEVGLHPTQKPVALMEYLVRTYTNLGDLVLDNCMGSGTTGVACVNSGRRFIGIEKDAEMFAKASERIDRAARDSNGLFGFAA